MVRLHGWVYATELISCTGSLIRVGPNEVITNNPEVLRKIMAVRSTYTRGHCEIYSVSVTVGSNSNLSSLQRDEI